MGRWVIRCINAGLLVLCCFLGAGIFNRVSGELLATPPVSAAPSTRSHPAPGHSWAERRVIVDRNLFGAKLGNETTPEVVQQDLAPTRLPLKLLGTAASPVAELSTAVVEDQNTHDHQVVRIGDRIENYATAQVVGIERRRIVLLNAGRQEELVLDEDLGGGPPVRTASRPAPRAAARAPAPLAERLRRLADNRFVVSQEGAEAIGRNPASLLQDCRPVPERGEGNQIIGYRLSDVKPGGICDQAGIQSGEVITEVNGLAIDNPTALSQILTELASAQEWNVVVRSPDGSERPVRISTQ